MAKYVKRTFTWEGERKYARGKTEAEAELNRELMKRDLEAGKRGVSKNMSVSAWAKEWLEVYKKPNVNSRHAKDIESVINNFIVPEIGSMQLKNVKPVHLQKILSKTTDYSDSYVSKIYDIIRQIFREAYLNNLTVKDLSEGLKKPSGKGKKQRRPLTPLERKLTLKVAEYYHGGTFVLIMLYCGLRPGEVAALTWSDVDMYNKVIHVRKALKADGSVALPKTSAGYRDVPLPDILAERLGNEKRTSMLVCPNTRGTMHTKSSMRAMFEVFRNEMNKAAGCKVFRNQVMPPYAVGDDLTLYCYRHTYCTDLQAAGVPINVAKELMGHSNISVTAQIYTHRSEKAFNDAAKQINTYISGKKRKKLKKKTAILKMPVAQGVALEPQTIGK